MDILYYFMHVIDIIVYLMLLEWQLQVFVYLHQSLLTLCDWQILILGLWYPFLQLVF